MPAVEKVILTRGASSGIGRGKAASTTPGIRPSRKNQGAEENFGRKDGPDASGTLEDRTRMIPDHPLYVNVKAL